jgi:hypothetical protein
MASFYRKILLADVLLLPVVGMLYYYFDGSHVLAAVSAMAITSLNAVVGYYYIKKYLNASSELFNSYVYGSAFGRLLGMMVVIGVILLYTNFPQITFILSLFISYIYKSVLEIIFIHKNSTQRHKKS